MATTGKIKGRNWDLSWNGTVIDHLTSVSFDTDMGEIDVTSYDSTSNYRAILDGTKSWNASCTAHVAFDATEGFDEVLSDFNTAASGTMLLTTGVTGDSTISGTAYCKLSVSGAQDGVVEMTISFSGTGPITIGTS